MSTSLYWKPAPKDEPPPDSFSYEVKRVLSRRYWDGDGPLRSEPIELTDRSDLEYATGLRDAGLPGADELVAALIAHDRILIWID